MKIVYKEERLTPEAYIDFLKRTNLGSQYPKERFQERIAKLVKNVSISCLVAGAACHGLRISEDPVKFKVGVIAGLIRHQNSNRQKRNSGC